ncbi:uncharacterized protein J3D65DRAFT_476076 [Phyllosticta citribraziliensis]|uniref:Uncharacterized protein n=1 Tax=Phyllosticta citribraziliensis TaxID=989973 RepID=A0ABR1LK76_9PEZI
MAAHTPSPTPSRRIISYPGSCAVDFLHGHGRTAGRSVCLCLTIEAPTPAADPSHPFGALWGCLALADLPPCAVGLWRRAGLHSLLPFVGASRCLFSKSWLGDVAAAADSIANIVLALKSHYRAKLGAEIRGTRWMSRYDREHSSSTWCGLRLFHQVLVGKLSKDSTSRPQATPSFSGKTEWSSPLTSSSTHRRLPANERKEATSAETGKWQTIPADCSN